MEQALESKNVSRNHIIHCFHIQHVCNKEIVHKIFLKVKLQIMQFTLVENFIFNFRISQIFSYLLSLLNFSTTEFVFAFAFFSHTKYFQCFVFQQPKQIKRFKTLSKICTRRQWMEPEFRLYLAKLCSRDKYCITTSLKNFLS